MAKVTWQDGEPAPNPFEATSGDFREYVVHLCTVSEASEEEIHDLFVDFFRRVFEVALGVERAEARKILIEVDTVYADMTVVVTDQARSYDERHVFTLSMNDWDVGGADEEEDESEEASAAKFQAVMGQFRESIRKALDDERLSAIRRDLRTRRFRLWIGNHDEDGDGEAPEELPLAGS